MRIIAGRFKGRKLKTVKGRSVRPTSDRVREAIFSVVGSRIVDSEVLDLFAGSGALGLEALSRGARSALFVERDARVVSVIKDNILTFGVGDVSEVWRMDVRAAIRICCEKGYIFDVVFLDPPYRKGLCEKTLKLFDNAKILSDTAMVVVEHESDLILEDSYGCLELYSYKTYGDTSVSFYLHGKRSRNVK